VPRSNEEARVVFAGTGKRPTTEGDATLSDEASSTFVRAQVVGSGAVAGWSAIDAHLARWMQGEKNVVAAFGTSHDSPAQIDAFRRLVGPRSTVGWTRVMLEQLYADGHWKNVDARAQAGDDDALDRYAKSGAREDIAALVTRVQRDTYTAWKYGSVDVIGDLIAEARAAGRPVSGCDMAPALRARFSALDEAWVDRMREVHCALAMRDRAKKEGGASRIAALWGRLHVHSDRFPQLVPADWAAIRVSIVDAPADPEIVLVDPIFIVGSVLVLPSEEANKRFERKRTKGPGARSTFTSLAKKSAKEPRAWVDGRELDGSAKNVAPGRRLLAVDDGTTIYVAAIEIPTNGAVQVTLTDDAPNVTATIVE
jgi:hypothetical protein